MVIGVVVIGPDKLPELVRSFMRYSRKLRRMIDSFNADIERELELDELRRSIQADKINEDLDHLNQSILEAEKKTRRSLATHGFSELRNEINGVQNMLNEQAQDFADTGIEEPLTAPRNRENQSAYDEMTAKDEPPQAIAPEPNTQETRLHDRTP